MRVQRFILMLWLLAGCERTLEPPMLAKRAGTAEVEIPPPTTTLEFVPIESQHLPTAVAIRAGERVRRTGPLRRWRVSLSAATHPGLVRVDPLPSNSRVEFYPLAVLLNRPGTVRLPLVPRLRLRDTVYAEMLDLLQEFVAPFAGSQIRRWSHRPITVALPSAGWPLDYGTACLEAVEAWNLALGGEWLSARAAGEEADVRCRVEESDRLAFTRLVEQDPDGRPTRMLVHVSPRWAPGNERYVRRTYLHELGHVLGLWGHSVHLDHVMNGRAVIRDELHAHELRAVHWLWSLPANFDLIVLGRQDRRQAPGDRHRVTRCSDATARGTAGIHPW